MRRAEPVQLRYVLVLMLLHVLVRVLVLTLLPSVSECGGVEYQRVTARGEFDYTTQVSIGPR